MLEDTASDPQKRGSALRYRPLMKRSVVQQNTSQTSRAFSAQRALQRLPSLALPWHILILGVLGVCHLLLIGQLFGVVTTLISHDLHHGQPYITQVDHFVGHEIGHIPSHFVAINEHGQVVVIEIPGGRPDTSYLLLGPRLSGPGSDLASVTLAFVGNPQHPDLLICAEHIQVRFRNTGSNYVPVFVA